MTFALQMACASLLGIGLVFIWIEIRTRFDRSFLIFGIALIMLSSLCAVDLWIVPEASLPVLYIATIGFHILAMVYIPFTVWYTMLLSGNLNRKVLVFFGAMTVVYSALFPTPVFFTVSSTDVVATPLYTFLLLPYFAILIVFLTVINARGIVRTQGVKRRILVLHLVGLSVILVSGATDGVIMATIGANKLPIPSFLIFGAIAFGAMTTAIFTERLHMLLDERERNLGKLKRAYSELEEVSSLKEIGKSAAMIGHEINNYLIPIIGNTELIGMKEGIGKQTKEKTEAILSSANDLKTFSTDLLSLARMHVFKESEKIDISQVIDCTIRNHFLHLTNLFDLSGVDHSLLIRGEAGKLNHVFVNLFNNAIEAGAGSNPPIRVCATMSRDVIVVEIDDNGIGCNQDSFQNLFTAFYTTKKKHGGTGLGMSIVRTIIEAHGGRINAYSKNLLGQDRHGLQVHIALPRYSENGNNEQYSHPRVILVERHSEEVDKIVTILQNVAIIPNVLESSKQMKSLPYSPQHAVLLATQEEIEQVVFQQTHFLGMYEVSPAGPYFEVSKVESGPVKHQPELLCESFAVKNFS